MEAGWSDAVQHSRRASHRECAGTNKSQRIDRLPPCTTDAAVHMGLCNGHAARLVSMRSCLCWQETCRVDLDLSDRSICVVLLKVKV